MEKFEIDFAKREDKIKISQLIKLSLKKTEISSFDYVAGLIKEFGPSQYSLKMTLNKKIIGFHEFFDENINTRNIDEYEFKEDVEKYQQKRGLRGYLFVIHPDYQKKGYGSAFIEYEKLLFKNKFDYIFGSCDIRFNNIEFWEKHRRIICNHLDSNKKIVAYETIMDL